jgi:hypothetical protein
VVLVVAEVHAVEGLWDRMDKREGKGEAGKEAEGNREEVEAVEAGV